MSVPDPSGLLSRIPELEPFARHPKVGAAIARGRPRDVWAALKSAYRKGQLDPEHAADAAEMLRHRRWFLEPAKPPTMFTLNGVGTSLYGQDELDPADQSFIATFFAVFVFIPVFPIAQYLVKRADKGGWYFFGKVPTGPFVNAWRYSVFAGVSALVLLGAASAWHGTRYVDVTVVNALPFAVNATIGTRRVAVGPASHSVVEVPVGLAPVVVATVDGRVVDRGRLDVDYGADVLAWNVLGAAFLARETIVYHAGTTPPNERPIAPQVHCGERTVRIEDADFVFETPPSTMSMPEHTTRTTRTLVTVEQRDSLFACAATLAESNPEAATPHLAALLAALEYPATDTLHGIGMLAALGRTSGLVAIAEQAVAAHDELDAHRAVQEAFVAEGRRDEIVVRYAARARETPESADATYLAMRLLDDEETAAAGAEVVTRFPDHVRLRNLVAQALTRIRRYEEAVREFEALEGLDLMVWEQSLDHVVDAYCGAARSAELLPRLLHAHETKPDRVVLDAYALLAPPDATPAPAAVLGEVLHGVNDDGKPAYIAAWLIDHDRPSSEAPSVLPRDVPLVDRIRTIAVALLERGSEGVRLAAESTDEDLANLGERTIDVLATEALRIDSGHPLVARLLRTHSSDTRFADFVAYARTGRPTAHSAYFSPSRRGLAEIVHATRADRTEAERATLLADARRDDVGTGMVHAAMTRALGD